MKIAPCSRHRELESRRSRSSVTTAGELLQSLREAPDGPRSPNSCPDHPTLVRAAPSSAGSPRLARTDETRSRVATSERDGAVAMHR